MEKGLIQVVPDSVNFRDLKSGESDSIQVWATNCGRSPMPIRFKLSPNSPFLLFTQPTIIVPPGLEISATIKYTPKDTNPVHAELYVECPKEKVTIPVSAIPPSPRIVPDTQNIRLGSIPTDFGYKFSFSMTNIGVREGSFELQWEYEGLTMSPTSGSIAPSKSVEISATIKIPQPGPVNINLNVNIKGSPEKVKPIVITAEAVSHSLSLFYGGKECKTFDFQTVYFGQKRIITAQLVNNGQAKRSFVILSNEDAKKGKVKQKRQIEEEIIFKAYPSEGTLEPNGKMNIDFQFIPPPPSKPILEDIDLQFNQIQTIEVVETGQHLEFSLNGKAVQSYIKLSSYDFIFDKCEIEEKTSKELVITNTSKFLPIEFEIQPIAHFRFEPSSGVIKKESSSTVNVIFFPKNYGEFKFNTNVKFCSGLITKEINLIGVCGQKSEKPFKRIPVYETNENARYSAEHPDRRFSDGIEGIRQSSQLRERFDGFITEYAAKRESITRMQELRTRLKSEGEEYLRNTVGQYTDEDLKEYVTNQLKNTPSKPPEEDNNGLYNGLEPPEPKILDPSNPLYFQNTAKTGYSAHSGDDPDGPLNTKRSHQDENVLIKKKFKPKPTTPAEINECSKPLTPAQQLLVTASHQTVNFGHVSVYSVSAKSFTITNNLQQHIVVSMKYEFEELAKSSPSSQVILPKQTAGFDIRFSSSRQQNFMKTIQYTINGHHTYAFNVSAQVVPIELQLSRQMIEFRFSPDSVSPFIKEFVTIVNKSNSTAEYTWTGLTPVFSLSQISGKIDPDSTQNIEVTYTPQTHSHDEATLLLNVLGGQTRTLKCVGDIGAPKCSLNKKFVNLGLIPIGILKTQTLRIKNAGDDDAIFSINYDGTNELQIIPMNGRIPAHDAQNLQLNFKSVHASSFDIPVNIQIAGSNSLTFNVSGQSELPRVQLSVNAFEFGRLFVGSSSSIEATIQNVGQIPAILFLDLSSHPDFRIEYATELADGANNESMNSVSLVSNPIFVTKTEYLPTTESSATYVDQESNGPAQDSSDDESSGLVYKFYLLEGTSIKFNLVFQPSTAAEHSFELPFTMMNVISASSFHLQPIVSAEAIKAPITISSTSLDFGIMPIFNPQNPHARSISRAISLVNESKNPIPWRIDNSKIGEPAAFSFEPSADTIAPGATTVVHVLFTARAATPYNVHLPLLVKMAKEKEESVVSEIQLAGVGTSKLFSISQTNVALPIVPLGVKSQTTVYINNDGFISSNLRVQTSASESAFPVKVSFPEGNQLLHTTVKLPIVVSFQSPKPLSFSTMIGIIDDNGNGASFTVTCTTDNSVFTLYPFLYTNKPEIKSAKGSPITVDTKSVESCASLVTRFINAPDIIELKGQPWTVAYNQKTTKFILRYLNALSLNTQISDFPGDFIRNNGSTLLELVDNISGGRRPNVDNNQEKVKVEDINSKQLEAMRKIIRFLQSMGLLVSHIRPEFLLERQEFVNVMRYRITKQLLGIDYFNAPTLQSFDQAILSEFTNSKSFSNALMQRLKIAETLYAELSNEAWMMVMMQLFKVFIVGRIDQERLNQQPGFVEAIRSMTSTTSRFANMEDVLSEVNRPNKSVSASNIYSTSECTLLKWISVHTCVQYVDWQRAVNSFEKLADATCFTALLKAHTTSLKVPLPNSAIDHSTPEDTAILFTSSLKSLKLAFSPTADEISCKSDCVLAIVAAYLFETLPRFIPIASVDFTTTLHKTISKAVQIQNPSKAEITYKAVLEGSQTFSLPNDSLIIPPNGTADINVVFTARTIKKQTARLILTPLRPRYVTTNTEDGDTMPTTARGPSHVPIFSAPIVVDIYSEVTIVAPDMVSAYEGMIYQPTKINLTVKNFIGTKSEPKIAYKISKIADETGKTVGSNKSISQQIQEFIANPFESSKEELVPTSQSKTTTFQSIVKAHKNFIIEQTHVDFMDENSTQTVAIEFLPIDLGTYRMFLLFEDPNSGEFVIQVEAKSVLPNPVEIAANKMKCESGKKFNYSYNLDIVNPALIKQLAYGYERINNAGKFTSDRKLIDMITSRTREIEALFKASFTSQKFQVSNSATQYFEMPADITITKNPDPKNKPNALPITFKPSKAGEYPVKIVLTSNNDIRLLKASATAIPAVKEMSIEFSTVSGRQVHQDIPLTNPSDEVWNFKVTTSGDSVFSAPQRVSVKPGTTGNMTVNFTPLRVGSFKGELMLTNASSEATVIYKLTGVADEPPAEKKINVNCKARVPFEYEVPVKSFVKNGQVKVTTTVPIITFKPLVNFENGNLTEPFKFNVIAQRSGVSAGTLTFTDSTTGNYIWYVVEIHVDSPAPEQTITVNTSARKSATVSIKIQNPKDKITNFTVVLSDDDLFGLKEFSVPPHETMTYELVVSPLKAMTRASSVYFYSDDDSEFWYALKITATEAPGQTLAPLVSPLGKFASTTITLENPLTKGASVRVENSNPTAFQVMAKRSIQLLPLEKRRVEIRYIPTSVGQKETAEISFLSQDVGDWTYSLSGSGKPPQPYSPTIVSSQIGVPMSALVLFNNPFPYPCRFNISIDSECEEGVFQFLVRKKLFTLEWFGEEYQVPFTFTPTQRGQFTAHIIVTFAGPARGDLPDNTALLSSVRWIFPVIGNTISAAVEAKVIRARANEFSSSNLTFQLVGETEEFQASEYTVNIMLQQQHEFLRQILDIKPTEVLRDGDSPELMVNVNFTPMRPCNGSAQLRVKNPLGQEWQFDLSCVAERGKPIDTLQIESLLNKTGEASVTIPTTFRTQTPFHAYMIAGSASEFSAVPEHGFIEPGPGPGTETPIKIVFAPKMYGKVLRGVLVIDTLDAQFLYDVVGKTPEYVPPTVTSGSRLMQLQTTRQSMPSGDTKKRPESKLLRYSQKPRIISPNSGKHKVI